MEAVEQEKNQTEGFNNKSNTHSSDPSSQIISHIKRNGNSVSKFDLENYVAANFFNHDIQNARLTLKNIENGGSIFLDGHCYTVLDI